MAADAGSGVPAAISVGMGVGNAAAAASASEECVATASLRAAGLGLDEALASLRPLLVGAVGALARGAAPLWRLGAPQFALGSLERPVVEPAQLGLAANGLLPAALPPRATPPALRLRPLPASFEHLFHDALRLRCCVCGAGPPALTSRAICLACGACVCGGNDALHGGRSCAAHHARCCGAGTSLFLLTSSSGVVLSRGGRLLLLPTPYRDAHGEVDLGLQRGKPLTLDANEYLGLTRKWLAHSFDDTAKGGEAEGMMLG